MINIRCAKFMQKPLKVQGKEVIALALAMVLCLCSIVFGGQKRQESEVHYESVAIHSGDTLWSIAKSYSVENDTIEHMILEIMKVNGMRSENIRSGDRLIVPVKNGSIPN